MSNNLFNDLSNNLSNNIKKSPKIKSNLLYNLVFTITLLLLVNYTIVYFFEFNVINYLLGLLHLIDTENEHFKKEVFNISCNKFNYTDAVKVCKVYGAELASFENLVEAHNQGANWCNYGWSKNKMALFPIQEKNWNPDDPCGKPGVNGGVFSENHLFGVNCYGYKPKTKPTDNDSQYFCNPYVPKSKKLTDKPSNFKLSNLTKNKKKISILPFSVGKWSEY
jgi:hypothetical protein